MKTEMFKQIVKDLQRHKAQIDVALGKPPRKSSKTYINAYANAYAEQEILTGLRIQEMNNVCL
jgi:hypothetical protein